MYDAARNTAETTCNQCGTRADPGRIFCAKCGTVLRAPAPLIAPGVQDVNPKIAIHRMRLTTKMGLGFIPAAVVLFLYFFHTSAPFIFRTPLAMTVGHVQTRKFKVNAEEPYNIYIEVEYKKIPSKTLNCLLGAWLPNDCGKISSVVNAEWTLTADGQVTQRGSSTSSYIGQFDGKPGHTYQIDINVLTDGTQLSPLNPRLTVSASSYGVELKPFKPSLFQAVIVLAACLLLLVGSSLLIFSLVRAIKQAITA